MQPLPRDFRDLVDYVTHDMHFTMRITGGNHLQLRAPDGTIFHTSSTPSDHRSGRELRSYILRWQKGR